MYTVGDDGFQAYLKATRKGRLGKQPFDLALHALRRQYAPAAQRQCCLRERSGARRRMMKCYPCLHGRRETLRPGR